MSGYWEFESEGLGVSRNGGELSGEPIVSNTGT